MKTKLFTLFIAALFFSSVSFAKIFRVGYTGAQVAGIDFTDAQAAHDAASEGDTLQIYPGAVSPVLSPLTKKLVVIGMGYFLDKNSNLQIATTSPTLLLGINAGGSGSIFEGLMLKGAGLYSSLNYGSTSVQNLIFKRCYFSYYGGLYLQYADSLIQNITFSQCYFTSPSSYFYIQAYDGTTIKGIKYQNCIFSGIGNEVYYTIYGSGTGVINDVTYENCSFNTTLPFLEEYDGSSFLSIHLRNCIFLSEPTSANNDVFDYCIFASNNSTHYITGTANQFGSDFSNIFMGKFDGSEWDSSFILKAGSPAIGYGRDSSNQAIDVGAYGGANPYKLSGIPQIPAFYKLSAPSINASSNPYTVTFSLRANN